MCKCAWPLLFQAANHQNPIVQYLFMLWHIVTVSTPCTLWLVEIESPVWFFLLRNKQQQTPCWFEESYKRLRGCYCPQTAVNSWNTGAWSRFSIAQTYRQIWPPNRPRCYQCTGSFIFHRSRLYARKFFDHNQEVSEDIPRLRLEHCEWSRFRGWIFTSLTFSCQTKFVIKEIITYLGISNNGHWPTWALVVQSKRVWDCIVV